MTLPSLIASVAAVLFVLFVLRLALGGGGPAKNAWIFPAIGSLFFLGFSAYAAVTEGSYGFWVEHTRNLWGNQIWFDLLFTASIGLTFVVPQARAVGMRPLPWSVLVVATGSIGFLAMVARLLYLREHGRA